MRGKSGSQVLTNRDTAVPAGGVTGLAMPVGYLVYGVVNRPIEWPKQRSSFKVSKSITGQVRNRRLITIIMCQIAHKGFNQAVTQQMTTNPDASLREEAIEQSATICNN